MSNMKVEVLYITPEEAQRILFEMPYDGQRPIQKAKVKHYAVEMRQGTFNEGKDIIIGQVNGCSYLIDGQHTLSAIVESKIPLLVTKKIISFEKYDDIAQVYSHIDIGKRRTVLDGVRAYGIGEKTGLTITQMQRSLTAIRWIDNGFKKPPADYNREKLYNQLIAWSPHIEKFFSLVYGGILGSSSPIARATTLSIALATVYYAPKKIPETAVNKFWYGVAYDDRLKNGDPRKALHRFLLTSHEGSGYNSSSRKTVVSAAESVLKIAKCWNYYVLEKDLRNVPSVRDITAPIRIVWTPYDGRGVKKGLLGPMNEQ